MCGIVATISIDHTKDIKEAFSELLFIDTLRGVDSTGVFSLNKNLEIDLYKRAVSGPDLIDSHRFQSLVRDSDLILVGHNRNATKGKVNSENAHPYYYGDIIGVHNGTLRTVHQLKEGHKFSVDSQALISSIDQEGIKKTYSNTNGAVALIWVDTKEGTFNMLRNSERPLHFGYSVDRKTIVIASEYRAINFVCQGNDIDMKTVYSCNEDTLYKISLDKLIEAAKSKNKDARIPKFTPSKLEPHVATYKHNNFNNNGYGNTYEDPWSNYNKQRKYVPSSNRKKDNKPSGSGVVLDIANFKKSDVSDIKVLSKIKFKLEVEDKELGRFFGRTKEGASVHFYRRGCPIPPSVGDTYEATVSYIDKKQGYVSVNQKSSTKLMGKQSILSLPAPLGTQKKSNLERVADKGRVTLSYDIGVNTKGTYSMWLNNTKKGCSWCSDIPRDGEDKQLIWLTDKDFLCGICSKDVIRH